MPQKPRRTRPHQTSFIAGIPALLAIVVASLAPAAKGDPSRPSDAARQASATVAEQLRSRIKSLLKAGRIDEAVRVAQSALRDAPDDLAIRREFIDLHISLARSWLAEERFIDAETVLDAVLRVQPGQTDASQLKQSIDAARRAIPDRLRSAREWIDLEWHEPAFNAFRQAIALAPEHRGEWLRDYRSAAVGAGDDEYLTKNFHQAFYYYDAALELGESLEIAADPALISRWLQSLVHALDSESRIRYPESYWKLIFRRIGPLRDAGRRSDTLKATLEGFAFEHAGDDQRAAQSYARAVGTAERRKRLSAAGLKRAAIREVRALYDPDATGRRGEEWRRRDTDAMQLLESSRFRVHHRNAIVAQRVVRALDFHFARLADAWALDLEEVPWEHKADVYLHADPHAFFEATGQSPPVTAISRIQLQGSAVTQKVIHAHLADPLLLSSSLAHELAHLMTAELRRDRPLPAVLTEGLALHAEPQCRHRQFARLFEQQKRATPVRRLLEFEDVHPTDADFYAGAHRLMTVLRSRVALADILELRGDAIDANRLARACGYANPRQLQRDYQRITPDERGGAGANQPGSTN